MVNKQKPEKYTIFIRVYELQPRLGFFWAKITSSENEVCYWVKKMGFSLKRKKT